MKPNKAKLIFAIILVAIAASLILIDLVSNKSQVEASSTETCDLINIEYDEANNDWIISPISIGFCYTIPEDSRTVWNGLFSYPDILKRFAQTIVKTGRGMTLKEVTQRVTDSIQTGRLVLNK